MQLVKMRPMHRLLKARCLASAVRCLVISIFCSRSWWWFWLVAVAAALLWWCSRVTTLPTLFNEASSSVSNVRWSLSLRWWRETTKFFQAENETRTLAVDCNSSVQLNIGKSIWKVVAQPTTVCQQYTSCFRVIATFLQFWASNPRFGPKVNPLISPVGWRL